ncbi:uncharacterized protein [Hetaerina americana]|uniref:uncharacterized protein n=1 Tax=Hetaerina americana TaxID=62018 RepID=UPI003A7F3429
MSSKDVGKTLENRNDSTDISDSSLETKDGDSGKPNEDIQAEKSMKADESDLSSLKISPSKGNDSSIKLVMDSTPEITKVPDSQYSEGESMGVTSQASTVEIESSETTAEKGQFSPSSGNEESMHRRLLLPSNGRGMAFVKNEEEQSFHLSQDEIFGSHSGVVSSTPQSVNPRLHSQGDTDVDMIPSSPEEKKMKSYSLMPALSGGKKYLKRERRILSLSKSPQKEGNSSVVVDLCNPDENPQNKENDESQETLYKGSEDILGDNIPVDDGKERPKSGVKRKFEEILKEGGPSKSRCTSPDEDLEVEIVEVKKSRKSVEFVGSKPSTLLSQKSISSNRSHSSNTSSSSSQSSTSSEKTVYSKQLHLIIESPKKGDDSMARKISNSEEFAEEDFTLHISPSQGSQLETGKVDPSNMSLDATKGKEIKSTGAMSTIMEVDEGGSDDVTVSLKEDEVDPPDKKDADNNQTLEVVTDCEVSGESCEAIRPSSPEYLSDDQSKSWMNLSSKPSSTRTAEENGKKMVGSNEGRTVELSECKLPESASDKREDAHESKNVPKFGEENADCKVDPASDLIRNGDPGPPHVHQWLLIHVRSDVDAATGHYSRTQLLEMFDYRQEKAKEYLKMKFSGRVSDVSKASSVDSKSSACMGDISSPPTALSPQSTSGEGKLFPLPPTRASIMSTFSHSSSSTSGSDLLTNPKVFEVPKFTKPFLPSNVNDEKIPNLGEVVPNIKSGKRVRLEGTSGSSEDAPDLKEQMKLEIEQWSYKYIVSTHCSQSSTSKSDLEEASKVITCERRYLTRRPKSKRASLRMKKKLPASSKTATPQSSSQSNQRNIEDDTDTQLEKSASVSNPTVSQVKASPADKIVKAKPMKRKSSRSSETITSSQTSSENGRELKSPKSCQLGSAVHATIESETPVTPGSSTLIKEYSEGVIHEGAIAFARFADNWYYPGKVRKREKDNRWIIDFDDGDVRSIREEFIVAVEVSQGQSLYADVGEKTQEYEPGIVTKIETKKMQVYYTVELDNGETKVLPRSKLCLTEDQVNILKEVVVDSVLTTPKRKADVSLDNVLEGRTRRKKSTTSLSTTKAGSSTPGPSKSLSVTKLEATVLDSSSVVGTASDCSELGYDGISGLEPAASPKPVITPGSKGKGPGRRKGVNKQLKLTDVESSTSISTRKSSSIQSQLGPIPSKGSTLFKGKYYILSYGSDNIIQIQKHDVIKPLTDTSTDGDGTDTGEGEFTTLPFDKKHLRKQLEAGGGKVFDRFKDECIGKSCFLISNRPNLTPDYVLALAADIVVVSHEWIINCCIQDKKLPFEDNVLSIGWSLEKKRYIEYHERHKQPLKNVEVVLASDTGHQFLEFWRKVLVMAGAHVRKVSSRTMSSQEDISYAKVVVSDHMCPEGILNRAIETGIPIVSTVWVKQTLIHGELRPFNGHEMYMYDFSG